IGGERIFLDVDAIPPGADFVEILKETVLESEALLAVIGPRWAAAKGATGTNRLEDPNDFVRIELETALARGVRVIPVLVDGAEMPREADLPEPLRPIVRRNAVTVSHNRFNRDVEELMDALGLAKATPDPAGAAPSAAPPASSGRFWEHRFGYGLALLAGLALVAALGLWVDANVTWADEYTTFFGVLAVAVMPVALLIHALRLRAVLGGSALGWLLLFTPPLGLEAAAVWMAMTPRATLVDAQLYAVMVSGGCTALAAIVALAMPTRRA
ncbi:MAG: TIR domain-containing protein, partial [Pseudomonadota bacterium]